MKVFHFRVELVARGFTAGEAFAQALHQLANGEAREVINGDIVFKSVEEEDIADEHISDLLAASCWRPLAGET